MTKNEIFKMTYFPNHISFYYFCLKIKFLFSKYNSNFMIYQLSRINIGYKKKKGYCNVLRVIILNIIVSQYECALYNYLNNIKCDG